MTPIEVTHGEISFSVGEGDVFALLSHDEPIKQSLFKLLTTLVPASSTGVLFRSAALDPYLSVLENLKHHGLLYGMSSHDVARGAERALERLALMPLVATRIAKLSLHARRRVELAKVLVPEPSLLVLDEPGTGLNPRERREFLQDLQRLRDDAGTTIVFTTERAEDAALATRVGILEGGHLSAIGKTTDLSEAMRRFAAA